MLLPFVLVSIGAYLPKISRSLNIWFERPSRLDESLQCTLTNTEDTYATTSQKLVAGPEGPSHRKVYTFLKSTSHISLSLCFVAVILTSMRSRGMNNLKTKTKIKKTKTGCRVCVLRNVAKVYSIDNAIIRI